ncbi:50S ribosomal protein L10 [Candidatus Micrarchaeota archaeon]|nr:50S ribosomal protein L10 [Candidatus Micrarchaeota archaeon]MBU2476866.1 50S ribosomal protein L10 [Candidatus Micrarchaeota archaeon]
MTSHGITWKEKEVQELKQLFDKYSVIGIASLKSFPANLFAGVRKLLAGKAVIKVTKTRIFLKALSESKLKNSGLKDYSNNSVAVIFTELNAFELFSLLKKNKGNTSAKVGVIALEDIIVPAGDTGLPPGPALSDLKAAGLKVKLAGASIEITEDKVVCKKGEPVSEPVASVLSKLNIKPIKVGLALNAVFEKGEIFKPEVLDFDEEEVFQNFSSAHLNSLNLALNISYTTKETIPLLLTKAIYDSMNLAFNAEILNSATIEAFIAKVNLQAIILKSKVKNVSAEKPAEEKKDEAKEEKPEETGTPKEEPKEKKEEPKEAEEKDEKKEEAKEESKPAEKKDSDKTEEK